MLFNSLQFLLFFPITVLLYWLLPVKWRNPFLLIASYYFYMNWEPVYALLIFFSTVTTWGGALLMNADRGKEYRKTIFVSTMIVNFGILFSYKYLNFIGGELQVLMDSLGLGISIPKFEVLLPVGISFYTFQAIGYLVDVWRRDIKPERSLMTYALFVSFFPQLVAGPIERAKRFLPQFHSTHLFNGSNLIKGIELMAVGYFMKLCIAENVAPYVNAVFNNLPQHNGNSIILATFFFTFQIFCDFGGYSLIAIGVARCMGFDLMQNFRQPYLATSVKDFWRRWHISLSTWFSDYLYIPMGGNRVKTPRHLGNLFTTFLVSGIWHGANYTFVAWGAYHGILQCGNTIARKTKILPSQKFERLKSSRFLKIFNIFVTFVLMMMGWVFFRANSISDAFLAFKKMVFDRGMLYNGEGKPSILLPLILIFGLMALEIRNEILDNRKTPYIKQQINTRHALISSAIFTILVVAVILLTARFEGGQFIYFQF